MTFYEQLNALNQTKENIVCTVLTGEKIGLHALFENGKAVGEPDVFFTENADALLAGATGIVDAGEEKVFSERLGSRKKMVICGGGHVSVPVIRLAKMTGFEVTVLEDRPLFAGHAQNAGADLVLCDAFEESLKRAEGSTDTFFVILTRGHRYDMVCLRDLLRKPYAYLGMIGSRLRVARAKEVLLSEGFTEQQLDTLHSPIGLAIGAETPEEIAISIMAEIIAVKNRHACSTYSKEFLKAVLAPGRKVTATIISRKGSAPREIGTRMAVMEDGQCVGTIGGGCAESDIIRQALLMMRENESRGKIAEVDMTGREAEDDGMVCGGKIKVFLEPVYISAE